MPNIDPREFTPSKNIFELVNLITLDPFGIRLAGSVLIYNSWDKAILPVNKKKK